jgi:hypothetical protein
VKPGSGLEVITDLAKKEITTLMKEDMIVIWDGTNDIAKNETNNALTHITNFVNLRKHTYYKFCEFQETPIFLL